MMENDNRVGVGGSSDDLPNNKDDSNNNDLLDSGSAGTQPKKKRKEITPRSKAWNHFDKVVENGMSGAKCRYCHQFHTYSSINGTTALNQHLARCSIYKSTIETISQSKINFSSIDARAPLWKFEQEVVRKALVEMIIMDELPFGFVEKEGFKKFMSQAQPLFRIPSRRTITRDCYALYSELRYNLKKSFREIQPKICLTTDTWTSMQRINYMCLTAHFIDRNWVLHKRILNFCPISSHKGEQMAEAIGNCLLDWNLDNVFSVTVDNASSNSVMITELSKQLDMWGTNIMKGKHLHVRCMAHILNLIVQEGLKEIDISVKRVRQMVRYVRSSSARTRNFVKCCEVQKIDCSKTLLLDVPTRWNSTYLMLEAAQNFEKTFDRFDLSDEHFKTYLSTHICEDGSIVGTLACDDWANVRSVVKFLEKFYELTIKVSGSHYVTSSVHFEDICELDVYLKLCLTSEDVNLKNMADGMMKKFKKYWGTPDKMNSMIYIAFVLDPRNKFVYVSFGLEELFGEENGKKVDKQVKAYMETLFEEYLRKYSKESQYQSSPSRSTLSDLSDSSSSCSQNSRTKSLRTKLHMKKQKENSGSGAAKSELERYLKEDQEPEHDDFDVLSWWKVNAPRFPILSELARDVLAIPISSVASECAFSTGGRILDRFRSSLTPKCVQSLVCAQDWLRKEPNSICVEESLEYLEKLELEMANSGRDSCIIDV
ncbi:hypothetical protein AABB24_021455 [Solanum stoloniferum]|uniref:BED-type domain-containing protein n=1 Tax=Solanum stoloniferum TaxID=62892 RepID=A0ABD2SV39_9SOLN